MAVGPSPGCLVTRQVNADWFIAEWLATRPSGKCLMVVFDEGAKGLDPLASGASGGSAPLVRAHPSRGPLSRGRKDPRSLDRLAPPGQVLPARPIRTGSLRPVVCPLTPGCRRSCPAATQTRRASYARFDHAIGTAT